MVLDGRIGGGDLGKKYSNDSASNVYLALVVGVCRRSARCQGVGAQAVEGDRDP